MQLTIPIPVGAFDASPFITEIEGLDDEPEDDPELDEAEADDGQVGVTVVEVQAQREETASSPRAIADDPDQQANERAGDPQSEHLEDGDIVFPESDAGEQPVEQSTGTQEQRGATSRNDGESRGKRRNRRRERNGRSRATAEGSADAAENVMAEPQASPAPETSTVAGATEEKVSEEQQTGDTNRRQRRRRGGRRNRGGPTAE